MKRATLVKILDFSGGSPRVRYEVGTMFINRRHREVMVRWLPGEEFALINFSRPSTFSDQRELRSVVRLKGFFVPNLDQFVLPRPAVSRMVKPPRC